jgi:hypothetical protein
MTRIVRVTDDPRVWIVGNAPMKKRERIIRAAVKRSIDSYVFPCAACKYARTKRAAVKRDETVEIKIGRSVGRSRAQLQRDYCTPLRRDYVRRRHQRVPATVAARVHAR